jgi:hypothetical protein
MIRFSLLVLVLVAGCGPTRYVEQQPVDAQCQSLCFVKCERPVVQWTGDANDPAMWDQLVPQVIVPYQLAVDECEARRSACAQCLVRLEKSSVVCGVAAVCSAAQPSTSVHP